MVEAPILSERAFGAVRQDRNRSSAPYNAAHFFSSGPCVVRRLCTPAMSDPGIERPSDAPPAGWRRAAHGLLLSAPFILLLNIQFGWIVNLWLLVLMFAVLRRPGALRRAYAALRVPILVSACLALGYLLPEWLHGDPASREWRRLLAPVATLGLAVVAIELRPHPRWIWFGLAAAAALAGGTAIVQTLILDLPREQISSMNAVVFGDASTLLALACCYGWAANRPGVERRILAAGAVSAGIASLLAQTRGAWLALPLLAGAALVSARSPRPIAGLRVGRVVLALLLPTLLAVAFGLERIVRAHQEIVSYFAAGQVDSSIGIRFELWRQAWGHFLAHPWIGLGKSAWDRMMSTWPAMEHVTTLAGLPHAHNDVLDALAQRGLAGLAGYVAFMGGWLAYFGRRRAGAAATIGILLIVAAVVMGLTETFMYSSRTFFLLCWLLCCMAVIGLGEHEQTCQRGS